jgi:cysteinyl-tRNA synthetase
LASSVLRLAGEPALLGVLLVAGCSAKSPAADAMDDFTYQLQNIDLEAIGATKFDLVVIDYSADGSEEQRFSAGQIAALESSPGGHKTVLAYLSAGEAEDYRWYWQEAWDADHDGVPDTGAPGWLGNSNPEWPGNYEVKYWDPAWQAIVFAYLDKAIAAGFDGVYLDVVDAYEYWGPGGESGLNRSTAEVEMKDFVKAIADSARTAKGKPDFLVFPQNAEHLAVYTDYLQTVSGIGREDVWYNGDTPNSQPEIDPVLADLDLFRRSGKPVLVIDYVRQQNLIDDFYARAKARGYVPYATVRDLDSLIINPGHEPK